MALHILSLYRLKPEHIRMLQTAQPDAVITFAPAGQAAAFLPQTDILIAFGQTDLAPILPQAPKLRWIHALSAGVDQFLSLEQFRKSDIILTNSRGIHGITIAEHVLGIMLGSSRCLFTAYEQQKAHLWKPLHGIDELYEKTAAVIGLGSIGHEIAKRLKSMGMKVLAVKRTITSEPFVDQLYPTQEIAAAVAAADYVIVSLPLTPETKGLFNRSLFQQMKPSAYFINIARGPIVNENDLRQALDEHRIRGAALDVFCQEPLPEESPLWDTPNLFLTPHQAANSPQYVQRTLKIFIENLRHFPNAGEMKNVVNKQRGY